jgi:hypothetical protein
MTTTQKVGGISPYLKRRFDDGNDYSNVGRLSLYWGPAHRRVLRSLDEPISQIRAGLVRLSRGVDCVNENAEQPGYDNLQAFVVERIQIYRCHFYLRFSLLMLKVARWLCQRGFMETLADPVSLDTDTAAVAS